MMFINSKKISNTSVLVFLIVLSTVFKTAGIENPMASAKCLWLGNKMFLKTGVLASLLFLITASAEAKHSWPEGYPFEPDQYTLLLAHFDGNLETADYAMGHEPFSGTGWLPRAGYYGAGIDLDRQFLHSNFFDTSESMRPFYFNFGFFPHGNFNHEQGSLEFWFLLKEDAEGAFFHSDNGASFGVSCRLSPTRLVTSWSTLGEEKIEGTTNFSEPLEKNVWHYYTQTWSAGGEFAVYIDGHLVFTYDMEGIAGIVSSRVDKPGIYIGGKSYGNAFSGGGQGVRIGLDELAVSSVVRYIDDFEPPWINGDRPQYAFRGQAIYPKRYDCVDKTPALAESVPAEFSLSSQSFALVPGLNVFIDTADGFIKRLSCGNQEISGEAGGILIWGGLERKALFDSVTILDLSANSNGVFFRQQYDEDLVASSSIVPEEDHAVWELVLENTSENGRQLEVQLSLPLPLPHIDEYFDGSEFHETLSLPRRKEEFANTIPFSAAGNGEKYAGVGLSSEDWVSDLRNEWVPLENGQGIVRQGFKTMIDPNSAITNRFLVFFGESSYGARKAVEQYYHAHDKPLYTKNPDVSVLTHMPCAFSFALPNKGEASAYGIDVARQLYCGHDWRFEPNYGMKGDEAGIGVYFKNTNYYEMPEYEYAKIKWDNYDDLNDYKNEQITAAKSGYEQGYTMHSRHWHPQCLNTLIINDVYPEGLDETGDWMQCGQKYISQNIHAAMVNTYNTPLTVWNQQQAAYFENVWGAWNKGFTHDTTYDCAFRAIDPMARQTIGRSFSADRGEFLRLAFGFGQWFQYLHSLQTGNRTVAALGDGSYISYITSTTADKNLTEGMRISSNLDYPGIISPDRILTGEKAFDAPVCKLSDSERFNEWFGEQFKELSEPKLRDYYRYLLDKYMLHCFQHGIYMSAILTHGKQKQFENRALMTEAIMAGYKVVAAATATNDLFVVRYGDQLDTILVAGNHKPYAQTSDLIIDSSEICGGTDTKLLFGNFYGGQSTMEFDGDQTILKNEEVGRRDVRGFRALGAVNGGDVQSASVEYAGGGITFKTTISMEAASGQTLRFVPFLPPDYAIKDIICDGSLMPMDSSNAVFVTTGTTPVTIEINYRHEILNISPDGWGEAELLSPDEALVQVVAPEQATEFDHGTLDWINKFVVAYDYEDNIKNNLQPVTPATGGNSDFGGWQVTMEESEEKEKVAVDFDELEIIISGRDDLARRRAMAVFMRLMDRKYPHIGQFYFPSDLNLLESLSTMKDRDLATLFEKYDFHKKPLLTEAYEHLYEKEARDFQGKYDLKFSPYIYEPGDWR